MILSRMRNPIITLLTVGIALLLASCGVNSVSSGHARPKLTQMPTVQSKVTVIPGQGQQMLNTMAHTLNSAKTLHGIFDLTLSGQTMNGSLKTEVWNATPNKSRTIVIQSSLTQPTTGTVTVTDGKQQWEYDPEQKAVYQGPVTALPTGTSTSGQGGLSGGQSNQSLFLLNLVQDVFTQSDGILKSSNMFINGHNVYDIHVVPTTNSANTVAPASFSYTGEVYLDKRTLRPVQVNINIQGFGNVVMNLSTLELNMPIPDRMFTFVVPTSVKVLPFSQLNTTSGSDSGTVTFVQAQQQAGYHLLSIPVGQADFTLNGVNALGTSGNQIYTLNYMKGNSAITIAEGKTLANLPASGQKVHIRGTNAFVSSSGGNTTVIWTEKGIGIRITSSLGSDQVESIAKSLV